MEHDKLSDYIKYAKGLDASSDVILWLSTTLKNYLSKNVEKTEDVEHVIDYLIQGEVRKMSQMSYPQAVKKADVWSKKLQKQAEKITEGESDTEVVLDFKDGFRVVKLIGENAYKREGYLMRHCVASYYGNGKEIYSLRDKQNNPHCTMERDQQIKGKGNGDIHPKYVDYVVKFLKKMDMTVGDSEMKHLGYINVTKFKKYLHKDTPLYKGKYTPLSTQFKDKDGNDFACLEMLDTVDLVTANDMEIKINFNLESFIKLSIDFLFKKGKKMLTGYSSKLASSGDYSKLASSGDFSKLASSGNSSKLASSGYSSQLASSGYSSQLASSGDSSKLASSGYSSQLASSGDSSKLASSGYSSKLASSGDFSKLASSGDFSKLASSGYSSKLASSGYSSQLASSGYSSQLASSGYYSKLASSGYSSQLEVNGANSVGANVGYDGQIRAIVGTWITLAEYDNDGKPVCVKSVQVDGKKIKENVWYQLKNKKFVEVK